MKAHALESPALKTFTSDNAEFAYRESGDPSKPVMLWGHGWGQSHLCFDGFLSSLDRQARHIAIDFPGFGASPKPAEDWSTEEYADAIAKWIETKKIGPIIWAGHSFGGRVGIRLASKYPHLVKALFIMAGAGLKRKRSISQKLYFKARILLFKSLKFLTKFGLKKDWLQRKFGSADYANAGAMKAIFVKTVNEDLTENAKAIQCPTFLFYGSKDNETPPEFGKRFNTLITHTELFILDGQDHYTILSSGRHVATSRMSRYLKEEAGA